MLSDVVTLAALVQQAPAMVLGAVALLLALWGVRQGRRADVEVEARLSRSLVRQGERLGRAEQVVELLDMRRRITEEELTDLGVPLSPWPPDGRKSYGSPAGRATSAPEDFLPESPTEARPAMPPLPDMSRHRR